MKIMKTTSLSLFQPALATLAILLLWGVSVRPAQAGYTVTLQQVGPNVVATGSGAIDLTGLSFFTTFETTIIPFVNPQAGVIGTGPVITAIDVYVPLNLFSGPTSFGIQDITVASSGGGDWVSISGSSPSLGLLHGYVSGNPLSNTATYDNATFSDLGATPGTYVWRWGTGVSQNFTLQIGSAAVPDSGSTFGLFSLALAVLFGASRLRSRQLT